MDTVINIEISRAEFNTILAALRFWQEKGMACEASLSGLIPGIACDRDGETSLNDTRVDEAGIDELCERIACGQGMTPKAKSEQLRAPELPAEVPCTHYYLITIWGDVAADQQGPYPTAEARDEAARAFMRDEGDDHGIHTLDVTMTSGGRVEVEVDDYSGAFFMDDDEGDDPGERPLPERQAEDEGKK